MRTLLFAGTNLRPWTAYMHSRTCVATKSKWEGLRGELKGIGTASQQVGQPGPSNQQERLLGNTQTLSPSRTRSQNLPKRRLRAHSCQESDRFSDTLAALHIFLTHRSCTHTVQQNRPLSSIVLPEFDAFHRRCTIPTTYSSSTLPVHSSCRELFLTHPLSLSFSLSRRSFERIYFNLLLQT